MSVKPGAQVRCACDDCGAHTIGQVGANGVAGWCPNCGSYQVTPVRITALKLSLPLAVPTQDHMTPPPFRDGSPEFKIRFDWPDLGAGTPQRWG